MKNKLLSILTAALIVAALAPALCAQDAQDQDQANANDIIIPEGTEFKLILHTTINSKTSRPGDRVLTTLLDPVMVEDQQVLPKSVRIDGHIGEVKPAGHRGKGGYLSIVFDTVEMPNGEKIAILGSLTEVFSAQGGGDADVGPEGDLKGHGASRKEQAALVIGPTAAGAAAGVGPGIAAAAGGIALAYFLPKGKQAELSAGSLIGMRLDRDVTVTLPPNAK